MDDKFLKEEINRLKKEKNIKIFAHYYQNYEVQEIADYIGDSFYLSKLSRKLDCDTIISCGVMSTAENIKILSPEKKVILPVEEASCSMDKTITPEDIIEFKKHHPDFKVVSYLNTTAEVKGCSDVCVTSSNAINVIESIEDKNIFFLPDMNLGNYISKRIKDKTIISWNGCCNIHDKVKRQEVIDMRKKYPDAPVLVHPECREEVTELADFVGSASDIIDFTSKLDKKNIIIGTETGILHTLRRLNPDKKFRLLSPSLICPNMKKTTLEDVYKAVYGIGGIEVNIKEDLRQNALKSLEEMIRLTK